MACGGPFVALELPRIVRLPPSSPTGAEWRDDAGWCQLCRSANSM